LGRIELTLLSKRKVIKSNENYGLQFAMKILNSPGCLPFRFEGLHLIEMICCHEIIRNEGSQWRKPSPFIRPSLLEKDVTVPAVEKDITGSGEAFG